MKEIELTISFNTPAFIGNAYQQGQWRTPPFKALFRQWWRVVKGGECNYNHDQLLERERKLFGQATADIATRSAVKFKLGSWKTGTFRPEGSELRVTHGEVSRGNGRIDPLLYLGYGPIMNKENESKTGIMPVSSEGSANLRILLPDEFLDEITQTVNLINWFGTMGSRSRNGWGSISVTEKEPELLKNLCAEHVTKYCRNLNQCLGEEWPHALGRDNIGPLIWLSDEFNSYNKAFHFLAQTKIDFRTNFVFDHGGNHHRAPERRHVIAYPITNHYFDAGAFNNFKTARLANQIRFKINRLENQNFQAIIFHLPCKAPQSFLNNFRQDQNKQRFRDYEFEVWSEIHRFLDNIPGNRRLQ